MLRSSRTSRFRAAPGKQESCLRQTRIIRPDYAGRFLCIGPRCEDTCCAGWSVSVDEAAHEKYKKMPAGPLRSLMDESIRPVAKVAPNPTGEPYRIEMLPSSDCPFLTAEHLCRIQAERGESWLPKTCATFPRAFHMIDGLRETELSLACPEAARLILLDPHLLPPSGASGQQVVWDENKTGPAPLRGFFWQIREFSVSLIRNRAYPLWQRLFLLGTFARRLDSIAQGAPGQTFAAILDGFSHAFADPGLRAAMDAIGPDPRLQLEMVMRLITQRTGKSRINPRMRQVFSEFLEGVSRSCQAADQEQVARYQDAYSRFYAPFFEQRPYILENYLLNAVLRDLFPFGKSLTDPGAVPQPAREFATLAIQFALIKGLLIGVAGARVQEFSSDDVIRTVQSAVKHFEHDRQFLPEAHELLRAKGLDDARGLTMLLRN